MEFADMHCDSLSTLLFSDPKEADLYHAKATMVDFDRMKKAGQLVQFFAVFMPFSGAFEMFGAPPIDDETYIETLRSFLLKNVEMHSGEIAMAYNAQDVLHNKAAGKMSAVLTMEDGRAVDGKLENVKRYYDMGFRAMALTWNAPNCFGAPNSANPEVMTAGLTDFGKEAVVYMQKLGMLVDVSHLSEGGFYDVAGICKKPFVATHSNCRGVLSPHSRGLTDDQLRILANAGGVTGLNYGPEFLTQDVTNKSSTAAMIAKHARHMADVAGVDVIALGSDFDGIAGDLEISDCTKVYLLEDALKKEGFTSAEIEKVFVKNLLRVMQDAMK